MLKTEENVISEVEWLCVCVKQREREIDVEERYVKVPTHLIDTASQQVVHYSNSFSNE